MGWGCSGNTDVRCPIRRSFPFLGREVTRFRSASDPTVPYSELHPERFESEPYQAPKAGVIRPIDDAPEAVTERSDRANVGFAHLKRLI